MFPAYPRSAFVNHGKKKSVEFGTWRAEDIPEDDMLDSHSMATAMFPERGLVASVLGTSNPNTPLDL